jgi:hypothetical protein
VSKDISIEKLILLQGKLYIFSVNYDYNLKQNLLLLNILNSNLEVIVSDKTIIASNFKSQGKKAFYISKDIFTNRFLVVYPENTAPSGMVFKLAVFNTDMAIQYNNSFSVDTERDYQIESLQLSDSSIAIIYKDFKENLLKEANDRYYLVQFNLKLNKRTIFKFFDDSISFQNLVMKYDPVHRKLICAGYYSYANSDFQEGISGIVLPLAKDTVEVFRLPFSEEMKNTILGKNNKKDRLSSYLPKAVTLRDDGGFLFFGEYYTIHKEVYNDYYTFSNNYVRYYYHYGNIQVFSINPDGTLNWDKVIRKEQVSMSDEGYYSSVVTGTGLEKIVILYNDITRTRTNLIYNTIDPNGKVAHLILVNGNSFNGMFAPRLSKHVSASEIILPGYENKKGFLFARVTFN